MSAETEVYVGAAGSFADALGAFACYFVARQMDSNLLLAVSYSGFFLNLVNLLPASPLDGGRITQVLSPRIWLLGAPMTVALMLYQPSPALILIAVVAPPQLARAWTYDPNAPENIVYSATPLSVRLEYAALYLGMAAVLAIMTYQVHQTLS
jgi:Zn-dependent protease